MYCPASSTIVFLIIAVFSSFCSTTVGHSAQNVSSTDDRLRLGHGKKRLPIAFPEAELTITRGESRDIRFAYRGENSSVLELSFEFNATILSLNPTSIELHANNESSEASVRVQGLEFCSRTFIDVANCTVWLDGRVAECPFNKSDVIVTVSVVKSSLIYWLAAITGWICFAAWSVSFYPQIILNFQRKSVIGLNFDFLLLNVIGFACYAVFNLLLYYNAYVQHLYWERNGVHSLIPVYLSDVVFAVHALIACIVTAFQCYIYDCGNQRISYICRGWASLLLLFVFGSLALSSFQLLLNWLDFINYLSYVKMAVTLSKYSPQAIQNFKRKSTVGWSIGNVLLDFGGGFLSIFQMCLQATNTDDWTGFTGNVVKFGLGLVSMLFDLVFIVQHYVLYRKNNRFTSLGTLDSIPRTVTTPLDQSSQRLDALVSPNFQ